MIDTREEVLSPATHRRRTPTVTATRSTRSGAGSGKRSLRVERTFSNPRVKPFDQIEWERRTAEITDDAGKVIFKQENVEVPKSWSVLATKVVVSKYFYGEQNTPSARLRCGNSFIVSPARLRIGACATAISARRTAKFLRRVDVVVCESIRCVQFSGVVQRRLISPVRHRQDFQQGQLGPQPQDPPG